MRGHHLVDLLVSYPHRPSNLQERVGRAGSGNKTIDLRYSSKFSWHNIFMNFVINLEITKILFTKFKI